MHISFKNLQKFSRLWERKTGKKLTRARSIEEFHKLVALVKLQAESAIREIDNCQSSNENS